MNNPYEVLGVSKNATEDEINTAYRKLIKQYHPDKYVGNPLADLAAEKIKEINEAYDAIMADRKKSSSSSGSNYGYQNAGGSNDFDSARIRSLLDSGNLSQAEMLLNQVRVRNAEWHYLMGILMQKKGWYDMAYQHLNYAANMEPSNAEYRNARDNLDYSGSGYRTMGNAEGYGGSVCDTCQALICADCCCEMCGGNLIPCIGCR